MSDFFQTNKKKEEINNYLDIVSESPQVYIIVDEYLNETQTNDLYNFIKRCLKDDPNYHLIYTLNKKYTEAEKSREMEVFYRKNTVDLKTLIPENSIIISIGNSIYSLTHNTDFNYEAFYDTVLNETSFYIPTLKSRCFPIPKLFQYEKGKLQSITNKIKFETLWSKEQIVKAFNTKFNPIRIPKLAYFEVNDIDKFLEDNKDKIEVAWDIETTGFNFQLDDIICITMSFDGLIGYYLDWNKVNIEKLNEFFKNKYSIGNNLQFDIPFLRKSGVTARVDFDNLIAGHIYNESRSNSLKSQAYYFDYFGGYEEPLDIYKEQYKIKSYKYIPKHILLPYACMDAITSFRTYKFLKQALIRLDIAVGNIDYNYSIQKYFHEIVTPFNNDMIDAKIEGVCIDWNIHAQKVKELNTKIFDIKDKLSKMLGIKVDNFSLDDEITETNFFQIQQTGTTNVDSNDQIADLFLLKGFKEHGINKKGKFCVNEYSLTCWKKEGHKEAELLLNLHELNTLQKTFVEGISDYKKGDGKLHPDWLVSLCDSLRTRSKNPNLQNLCSHGWKANLVKSFYCPPSPDYSFMSVDQSGLQLRISAMVNGDDLWRDCFLNHEGDLHSRVAFMLFNKSLPEYIKTIEDFIKNKKDPYIKEQRFKVKSANFGIIFGCSAQAIVDNVLEKEWTLDQCKEYIKEKNLDLIKDKKTNKINLLLTVATDIRKWYFETYKGLAKYLEEKKKIGEQGYFRSMYGCIRRLPYLKYIGIRDDEDNKRLSGQYNICLNSDIQTIEAVIMYRSMINITKELKEKELKTKIMGTIHDAIELYLYKPEKDIVIPIIKKHMEQYFEEFNGIKLEVEGNISDYYGNGDLWDMGKDWLKC